MRLQLSLCLNIIYFMDKVHTYINKRCFRRADDLEASIYWRLPFILYLFRVQDQLGM